MGPARYGWWARWPSGRLDYLGRTAYEAEHEGRRATEDDDTKIPKLLRSRVSKIMRAIKAGMFAVKQGKDTPSKYALSDARDRYTAFANLYKDERITDTE